MPQRTGALPKALPTDALAAVALVAVALTALSAAGCANPDGGRIRAAAFAAEARATGVAPHMTTRLARSMYGTGGGPVCAALDGSPGDATTAWGRARVLPAPREHVRDLVAYDRLVVQVYCPERMAAFDKLMRQLHYD